MNATDFTWAIRQRQTATICEHHELELLHVQWHEVIFFRSNIIDA